MTRAVPWLLAVLLGLAACGQKGPLYPPQPAPGEAAAETGEDDGES